MLVERPLGFGRRGRHERILSSQVESSLRKLATDLDVLRTDTFSQLANIGCQLESLGAPASWNYQFAADRVNMTESWPTGPWELFLDVGALQTERGAQLPRPSSATGDDDHISV